MKRQLNHQNPILQTIQAIKGHLEAEARNRSKLTPAIAKAMAMKVDSTIRSHGRSAISVDTLEDKIDFIAKQLMGISSANLLNLASSEKGSLLNKGLLIKGIVSEDQKNALMTFLSNLSNQSSPISFQNHSLLQDLFECSLYPILEKQLEPSEIKDLLDDIQGKLKGRTDKKAKSIMRLMRDFEKTLQSTNRLPVNAVITIMRTSAGLNGKWGKASSGWSGKGDGSIPPFPPSPTRHAQK